MRRLGVDPGSVRTGLSIADDVPVATPLSTITHKSLADGVRQVAAVAAREGVAQVVVGLPLSLGGREGEAARRARRFAEALEALTRLPVVMWDERLSSASAERSLTAQGKKGAARRGVVDQAAATLLLQSYLDAQRDRTWDDDAVEVEHPEAALARARPRRARWDPQR